MRASASATSRACLATFALTIAAGFPGQAQVERFTPVTDAMLQDPAPADWLMWRRTLNGWGYSPLDQIDRDNVGDLRLVWTRALSAGSQEGTPLAYDGVLYMPNPNDHLQAIDAVTGDLRWEYRRELPDDAAEVLGGLVTVNRNVAIYGTVIIDTGNDGYVYAVDLRTQGRSEIRNWALEWLFQLVGFNTLRHVGTADHLHISISPHGQPGAI